MPMMRRSPLNRIADIQRNMLRYQIPPSDIYRGVSEKERPRIYLLEGMNGAGKNTAYEQARKYLLDHNHGEVVLFRQSREVQGISEARKAYRDARPDFDERSLLALVNAERRVALLERLPAIKTPPAVFLARSTIS